MRDLNYVELGNNSKFYNIKEVFKNEVRVYDK